MKKMILLMSIVSILLSGCYAGSSKSAAKKQSIEECIIPHNPYNDSSGHDAGFDWARLSDGKCDNRSQSFNEGCSEYYRQLAQYNKCTANSRQ
jgi:hypothetical protein